MISGYPHQGVGLFDVACSIVGECASRPIQSIVVSLGGFGAPRAQKYLGKRILPFRPHYVVLQFGSTDAQCPVRDSNRTDRPKSGGLSASQSSETARATFAQASNLSYFRWELASLIGAVRKLEPITPINSYRDAMATLVKDCKAAGVTPVVLSPFIYGSRYTARKAVSYVSALREIHSKEANMLLIDCMQLLGSYPKKLILQDDGFHLSPFAHGLIGRRVGEAILADLATQEERIAHLSDEA